MTQTLSGIVVHGQGRGRELGFPTANLKLDQPDQRPANGVYAAWAFLSSSPQPSKDVGGAGGAAAGSPTRENSERLTLSQAKGEEAELNAELGGSAATGPATPIAYPAAVHVGPVPTFNETTPTIEVHLLDFPDQDLYEQTITLQLVTKLRDIEKFSSPEELVTAIEKDIRQTRQYLTKA